MASQTYEDPVGRYDQPVQATGWVGWGVFAAVMMIIGGSLNVIYGLIAVVNDDWVGWSNRGDVFFELTTWGWIHMVAGVVVALAGFGVLSGNVLARTIGVLLAGISLVVNFLFIPVFPIWALAVVTVDALVIWALTAHGRELRAR